MMALQQLWEKMFMNWNLSALERGNFRRVIVHGDHRMAEFRETCCGNQTDVSRANQSNAHRSSSAVLTAIKSWHPFDTTGVCRSSRARTSHHGRYRSRQNL